MKKQIIRLTENDLHNIIKETVQQYLSEDGATSCCSMTADANAAGYEPPMSGIISKPFQEPAMKKNKNGSVSMPDKRV